MPYEIDFLPVGDGCSGDAIAIRFRSEAESQYRVLVIDGGTEKSGQELAVHLKNVYGVNFIDFVLSTHPDNDHASGLRVIFEEFSVGELWMHIPWLHAAEAIELFESPTWNNGTLSAAIKRGYPIISEIVDAAVARGTLIYEPFQGSKIGPFTVLSPTKTMYVNLLSLFRDTPRTKQNVIETLSKWVASFGQRVAKVILDRIHEKWGVETLREGGLTSAENESSVVLYGEIDDRGILFTADAGIQALNVAANFLVASNVDFSKLRFFQMPHHGSRNNISPSILNRLIGSPVGEGQTRDITVYASAGLDDEDHPRKVVVNAFLRRGASVFSTRGNSLCNRYNTLPRSGWSDAPQASFSKFVEEYD